MNLLAIDAGTTHCKVGLFAADGTVLAIAGRPMVSRPLPSLGTRPMPGSACYDPDELWALLGAALAEVSGSASLALGAVPGQVLAVGLSSMAETGLLLERSSGRPRTPFLPWFETATAAQANLIALRGDPEERFRRTGLHPSHKSGLAKLLWLRDELGVDISGCTWLSVADYLAYRLTGQMATDFTLAARTLAFRLDRREWDGEWLGEWELDPSLFPPALPGGSVAGETTVALDGLAPGTPVVLAGHDHVCAALAAGATRPGPVLDSMGTAEVLLGSLEGSVGGDEGYARPLGQARRASGLLYGPHLVPGRHFWMGSLSRSGAAVEWMRGLLRPARLSYAELDALVAGAGPDPTGILYHPHGGSSGLGDGQDDAAFLELSRTHTRADLARAVLEGTAYEIERLRRTAEVTNSTAIDTLVAVGGGTRLPNWLQIKADVSGVPIEVLPQREATLLGAALLAGSAIDLVDDVGQRWGGPAVESYTPDGRRHCRYRELFEGEYVPFAQDLAARAKLPGSNMTMRDAGRPEVRNDAF